MPEGIRKKGATYSYRINYKDETGEWRNDEKSGFKTQAEAKAARVARLTEIGTNPDSVLKKDKPISLDEVYDEFVNKQAMYDRAASTLVRYDSLYRNHIQPYWGNRNIGSVKATELTDYLYSLSPTHSYSYLESIQKFLKVLWDFADKRQYLKKNISSDVQKPAKARTESDRKIYSEAELNNFENRFCSTNLITAYKLGRALGIRCSECFGLLWTDINWQRHTVKIDKQLLYIKKNVDSQSS